MLSLFKTRKLAVIVTAGVVTTLVVVAVGLLVTRDSSIAAPERAISPTADIGRAPTTTTTPVEPPAPTVPAEDAAALNEYLAALEAAQQQGAPDPAVAPPSQPSQPAANLPPPPAEDAPAPSPVSPGATVPDNQPLPPDPAPEGNFGLPSNPFSHPSASFLAEGDRRPGVRVYAYSITGGPADWCNTLESMVVNAGYTVSYKACEATFVSMTFYGGGRAGDAIITTNAPGSLSIELRA